jgi:hypothetical protein
MYSHASFKGNPRKGIINIEEAPNAPIFLREVLCLSGQAVYVTRRSPGSDCI